MLAVGNSCLLFNYFSPCEKHDSQKAYTFSFNKIRNGIRKRTIEMGERKKEIKKDTFLKAPNCKRGKKKKEHDLYKFKCMLK